MVNHLASYKALLQRAADIFNQLIELYRPDIRESKDWAAITVAEASTQRDGLLERLASPKLSSVYTSTFVSSVGHYIDSH